MTATSSAVLRSVALLIVSVAALGAPARAESTAPISMECRHAHQLWSPCHFVSEQPGARWELAFSNQIVRFQHDGSGTIEMQIGEQSAWTMVQGRWTPDGSLCWNTVCARGNIPLD